MADEPDISTSPTPIPDRPRVFELIGIGSRFVFGNLGAWFRAGAVPIVIYCFWSWVKLEWMLAQPNSLPSIVMTSIDYAVYIFATTLFAVKWHRFYLLDDAARPVISLHISPRELRFAGYFVVAMLALVLTGFIIDFGEFLLKEMGNSSSPSGALEFVVWMVTFIPSLIAILVFYRLCLVLPAAALDLPGDWRENFKNSWHTMGDTMWTMFFAFLVILIIVFIWALFTGMVFTSLLLEIGIGSNSMMIQAINALGVAIIMLLFEAVTVTMISETFRRLTGWSPKQVPETAPRQR